MNQSDFNKKERFNNLLQEAQKKNLSYRFILDEFKRNKWNLNLSQAEEISTFLNADHQRLLKNAIEMNILNVDARTKKVILKKFNLHNQTTEQ